MNKRNGMKTLCYPNPNGIRTPWSIQTHTVCQKKKKKDECRMKTISYSFPVETHAFQPSGAIIPSNTDL